MTSPANPSPPTNELLDLDDVRLDPAWALRVPATLALRKRVLPLCKLSDQVSVACADPEDEATLRQLVRFLDCDVLPVAAEPESLRRALVRVYGGVSQPGAADPTLARLRAGRDGRPAEADDAVAICDELLQAAALRQASDIHLLPREGRTQVLLRVDGRLESYRDLSAELQGAVVSRLKVLAGLDIAEKRAPQDGRFTARIGPAQTKIDIRTATLPTRFGERVTLRLLAAHGSHLSLESLGMTADDLGVFRTAIQRPHGLVLLTGPTGSGKSTTLYAALAELLSTRGGNVITVEDPIEYEMSGVSQVEVDSADKVNFSRALRSLLRHDPDVVMIGEIRDDETAAIAIKAALTGHLVFSTLHTNTAAGVVTRLVDMGMQRFLVAATLRLSVAQRLVRRLCPHCRAARPLTTQEANALENPTLAGRSVFEPSGCVYCAGRGYVGRVALFEMVPYDESLSQCVADGVGEEQLIAEARRRNRPLLLEDAVGKLLNGTTSLGEVLAAVVSW